MTRQGLDLQQIPALGQQLWLIMAMVGNKPKSSPSVLIALFRNLSLAVDCPSACSGEKCYVILSANHLTFDNPLCVEDAKPSKPSKFSKMNLPCLEDQKSCSYPFLRVLTAHFVPLPQSPDKILSIYSIDEKVDCLLRGVIQKTDILQSG